MSNWKEGGIKKYLTLKLLKESIEKERVNDSDLLDLKTKRRDIEQQMHVQEGGYGIRIENVNAQMQTIKDKLMKDWDIEGKKYKCDLGSATLRTTKSLIITDNWALIDRLAEILDDKRKAFDCIRTFDQAAIRKYMDVNLIPGHIAHYDEKRNIVISTVKNGGTGKDDK